MSGSRLDTLPPDYPDAELLDQIRQAARASTRKLVVLDDDPTGVQTVHDTTVLTRWPPEAIERAFRSPDPLFFILTNSRARSRNEAIDLNGSIARSVLEASRRSHQDFVFVSRSDSTLRGHFVEEIDVLGSTIGGVDGVIFCPAFIEGGRITIDGTHYVRDADGLTPVGETEFARDTTFGFRSSFLPDWVEERSGGRIPSSQVAVISLTEFREGGPDRVTTLLGQVTGGQVVVLDAVTYRDIEVASLGLVRSEAQGKRFLYRCGASLVRVRAGMPERPLLSRTELLGARADDRARGLVIVGSHVRRTTLQLEKLLTVPGTSGVELSVPDLLASEASRRNAIDSARSTVDQALRAGRTPVLFTSRKVVTTIDQPALEIGKRISDSLIEITRSVTEAPHFIVVKGGITSSDIGTEALGVQRAVVIGQARAGVPVWRLGPETPLEGVPYVIFPGNVGEPDTLANLVAELAGTVSG